jgi:hypothetical protein
MYIDFPILDSINLNKINERLKNFNPGNQTKFFHFKIQGVIDDYEMLDFILFMYIIIGCLKNDIYVSFRNPDDPIYIEISNTFSDYIYNSISILPLLPNNKILVSRDNIQNFEICFQNVAKILNKCGHGLCFRK